MKALTLSEDGRKLVLEKDVLEFTIDELDDIIVDLIATGKIDQSVVETVMLSLRRGQYLGHFVVMAKDSKGRKRGPLTELGTYRALVRAATIDLGWLN